MLDIIVVTDVYVCKLVQAGESVNERIIFKEIDAELRTNHSFRNKLNEEHIL